MSAPPPSNDYPYPGGAHSMNVPIQQQHQQQQFQQPPSGTMNQFEIGDAENTSFQPIELGHVGTGAMDNSAYPPAQPPAQPQQQYQQQQQQQLGESSSGWLQKLFSCVSIGSLQSYFDVDTEDVKDRVIGSVLHANSPDHFVHNVLRKEGKSADLYGPVWITLSCVFLFAVTSNTSKFLHTESLTDFEYDISHLTRAFNILSFYTFILPLILFLVFQVINVPLTLVELISLYGYSLVSYLPITIMCLFPSVLLEWFFLLVATVLSLTFILRNVVGAVVRSSRAWSGPVAIGIMGCHCIFFFVLKWNFYRHRYHTPKSADTGGGGSDNGFDNMDDGLDEDTTASTFDDIGGERW